MGLVKTRGIVLKEVVINDSDKILTVLTDDVGKISVIARGAKRSRSGISAGAAFLCYSEFTLFQGKQMYITNGIDIIDQFYQLRMNIEAYAAASYFAEVVNDVVPEGESAKEILKLLLNCLHFLRTDEKPLLLLKAIFDFRLMCIIGYAPNVIACACCGKEVEEKDVTPAGWFSFDLCGCVCETCAGSVDRDFNASGPGQAPPALRIRKGSIMALRHIVFADFGKLFSFTLSQDILTELYAISERYLRERTEKQYKTVAFLKQILFS